MRQERLALLAMLLLTLQILAKLDFLSCGMYSRQSSHCSSHCQKSDEPCTAACYMKVCDWLFMYAAKIVIPA